MCEGQMLRLRLSMTTHQIMRDELIVQYWG
jgi:hypothetical protein